MINFHQELLELIKNNSGKETTHTPSDTYLGTKHPRYAISAPVLRKIAREWMRNHKSLDTETFEKICTDLISGESATEKMFAGMLMDLATYKQGNFDPKIFNSWLDHLEGWAEVDSICTGAYTIRQIPENWNKWKPVITSLAKDKNIFKRRASLVLLCSPISHTDDPELAEVAIQNIERLKSEKDVIITKAISWLLRSMIRHYKKTVAEYLKKQSDSLPKIAVRETMVKLKTGKKTNNLKRS